jgi:hypothetical protein
MNQLDRLEALAQRLIEGTFSRFFQTKLPDKEIERKIETREALTLGVTHLASQWLLQWDDQQMRLGEPVLTLGRALDNDIILNDPTVSRYHAQLRWREGCYHLYPPAVASLAEVKSSASGWTKQTRLSTPRTTVNRRPVSQCPLQSGDILTLGQTTITLLLDKSGL